MQADVTLLAETYPVPLSPGFTSMVIPAPRPSKQRRKHRMMQLAKNLWNDESGQGLAEYALLLGLIVVGVVILIQGMGVSIKNIFGRANSELQSAATPVT